MSVVFFKEEFFQRIGTHKAERYRFIQTAATQDGRNMFPNGMFKSFLAFRNITERTGGLNILISVNTGYFFCNIGHFRTIDTPCRYDSRQYFVVFFRLKTQGCQDGNHICFRNIRTEEVIDSLCCKVDAANFLRTYIFINNAGRYFASPHLLQQLSRPVKGVNTPFRIEASFKTGRRFGTKS